MYLVVYGVKQYGDKGVNVIARFSIILFVGEKIPHWLLLN